MIIFWSWIDILIYQWKRFNILDELLVTIIFFCKFKYKGHPAIHSSLPRYKGKLIRYTNKKTWTPNVCEMACFLKAYVFIITLLIIPKIKTKKYIQCYTKMWISISSVLSTLLHTIILWSFFPFIILFLFRPGFNIPYEFIVDYWLHQKSKQQK